MAKANKPNLAPQINDNFPSEKINTNLKGQEIIKYFAKNLPHKPGIYQMEDKKGEILYIGKAKNLAKRVINYSSFNNLTRRLQRMVNLTKNMNFSVTNTEIEALLLECNLIKRHKPRFNIVLRDDKSFPFILINKEHEYPRIQKYRGSKKLKGEYFGPFVSPSVADFTLLSLQKAFLLRSCSDTIFSNRKRPCLLYDIERCSAPCVNYISKEKYIETLKDAKRFLSGSTRLIESKLKKSMMRASKLQMFEEAGRLRDRIRSINQIQKYQSVYLKDMRNIDIFAVKVLDGKSCIHGKFYRNGSNYGNKSFFPIHENNSLEKEILESFLYQFYSNKDAPPKILINQNPKYFKDVEKILSSKNKIKTKILQPLTGEKFKHLILAEKNASESIKLKKTSLQTHQEALKKLQNLLKLKDIPQRIEVYDNSHIFGKESVGVMIVADRDGLSSKNYRKYNIRYNLDDKKQFKGDDYYMMKEVMLRRFKTNKNSMIYPDVIIVDGGRGQFNIVEKILALKKLNDISIISIAKGKDRNSGREILHLKNKQVNLPLNDSLLFFIQRIRDEAHRFAITSHRARRSKKTFESIFNDLSGIGAKRKKILMLHFGSLEKIKNASKKDLMAVPGIPKKIINKVYDFFHSH